MYSNSCMSIDLHPKQGGFGAFPLKEAPEI